MKARPRRIENTVAAYISDTFLSPRKTSKVERIPVLGRTGPDIDVLPVIRVAVDVKSRKSIPQGFRLHGDHLQVWGGQPGHLIIGTRLSNLEELFDIENRVTYMERKPSVTVTGWLEHMDKWCDENKPILPALVLHWPGTPVKHSTFVIFNGDRRTLHDRRKCFDDLQL